MRFKLRQSLNGSTCLEMPYVFVAPISNEAFDMNNTELAQGLLPNDPEVREFLFEFNAVLLTAELDQIICPPLLKRIRIL